MRASEEPEDIVGLPTGEITAIALADDGTAYLACGTERMDADNDRGFREPFVLDGEIRLGGVARIAPDGTVTVLTADGEIPDPRGIALEPSGDVLVLDREKGLLRFSGGAWEVVVQEGVPSDAIPTGLWIGAVDTRATLYDQGALISIGDESQLVEGVGHTWHSLERAPHVLVVGTDEGLLRIHGPDAGDVVESAIEIGAMPPFTVVIP